MSEQELAIIVAIGDALRASPLSWNQIPEQQKAMIIEIMRPKPTFDNEQRTFLERWWMAIDDAELASINAKLPANTVVSPRIDGDGGKWICADLFTDAVEASGRLHAILDDLLGLTLHYLTEDYWTVDDSPP